MTPIDALILGILQGLTEFLPVSSSGHLELGNYFLETNTEENLLFTVFVHGATALSTMVVFRKEIARIFSELLTFRKSESLDFSIKILISMIPVTIVGLFFEEEVESLFTGNVILVAGMLLFTAVLLIITYFLKDKPGKVSGSKAFIIGIAQAIAVIPGISRSGATISTALMTGISRDQATRFSFLMVLPPILGAMLLKIIDIIREPEIISGISVGTLTIGFIAAFVSGLIACTWMIRIVRRGKLIYFAFYLILVSLIVIIGQW